MKEKATKTNKFDHIFLFPLDVIQSKPFWGRWIMCADLGNS